MKRSFQTANKNTNQDGIDSLNGIGPTTAQAQGSPNAQAEQAQNQLAIPSLPFTLTEKGLFDSLRHHGSFSILPFELITRIVHSFPSIESLVLRPVSKPFCLAWEAVAKNQLFISKPTIHHLTLEQGYNTLHEQQQAEIKYLIENKAAILEQNNNDPRLINAFATLALLENNTSLVVYHAKEKCLTSLNETIIRIEIAKTQQRNYHTELSLNGRHLTRFPSGIISDASLSKFWKKITRLYVSYNKLTTLPDTLGQCTALEWLSVNNNQLTTLPDTLGQCTALQMFNISYNQLTTLPDTLGQCTALQMLNISYNQLTTLPDTIGQCAALQYLCVYNNELTTLPDTLGQCTALQQLNVGHNQLTTLPNTIGQCAVLQLLSVRNNQLTALPDTLGQCAALSELYVTENKLKALPKGLRDDIFYHVFNKINKAQCLALQKTVLIKNEEETQERSTMRPNGKP